VVWGSSERAAEPTPAPASAPGWGTPTASPPPAPAGGPVMGATDDRTQVLGEPRDA
jgi:hypothetical protein